MRQMEDFSRIWKMFKFQQNVIDDKLNHKWMVTNETYQG